MATDPSIQSFSTQSLPAGMRLDYWMNVLQSSLWPVTEWTDLPADFSVDLQQASLGCISSMREIICPSTARRTRGDVNNSAERSYHLFANVVPWSTEHNGHSQRLLPGDLVLLGDGVHQTCAPAGFDGVILKCPAHWVRSWLPEPDILAGRRIEKDSRWGRVLSPLISQLTPDVIIAPPVPHGVLVDQIGAVLALMAGEAECRAMPDLLKKIQEQIRQRCSDPQLTAADVAASLNVPPRELHRVIAVSHQTFASMLQDARASKALQMLQSPSFKQLTPGEVGRLAGFLSPTHFVRVMRKRYGDSLLELRNPGASAH